VQKPVKSKYIVGYTSPITLVGLVGVEALTVEYAIREARSKLRLKYGDNACFCTITKVTLRKAA
jgi:hypothetical protein